MTTTELYIGNMGLRTWYDAVVWMNETFEPGSWYYTKDNILISTGPNITMFMLRWL